MRIRLMRARRPSVGVAGAAGLLSVTLLAAACGSPPPSVAPSIALRPAASVDPHLPDPTTADDVFRAISAQGLRLTASNAITGTGSLVKRINASFGGWPLTISEYDSTSALASRLDWPEGEEPGGGEPAVAVAASNILITWGPTSNAAPVAPDPARAARLTTLAEALDTLLGPVRVRSVVTLPVDVSPGTPADVDPSAEPEATPEG
jgi:hypothetical protein